VLLNRLELMKNMSSSQGAAGNATPKLWSGTPPQYQFSLGKRN